METKNAIGRCKGPAENNEYRFISPEDQKIGEFVYYEEEGRKIIGVIRERTLIRSYPDYYMQNPSIEPSMILSALGIDNNPILYQITTGILGYYDNKMGFVNPRVTPKPGTLIFLVEDETLKQVINKKSLGEVGSANIGRLLHRPEVPVILDVSKIMSTHLAILASTGSGKSYTLGVLLEEMMNKQNQGSVLVMDPHSEYGTLVELNRVNENKPTVKVYSPGEIKIRVCDLGLGEFGVILKGMTDKMFSILNKALGRVRKQSPYFTVDQLMEVVQALKNDQNESTIEALTWRLEHHIKNSRLFDDYKHVGINTLLKPNQITIIQLSELSENAQQVMVSTILRRAYKARMNTEKKLADESSEYYLDFPVFLVLEEAHKFCPANAENVSKSIIKTILSEGRKFGLGTCLISQRPGKLDPDSLSQCLTQIIMKIINPVDQSNIKSSVESVSRNLLEELPALTTGQAIISGKTINTGVLVTINKRKTSHGGEDINAPEVWLSKNKKEDQLKQKITNTNPQIEDEPLFK